MVMLDESGRWPFQSDLLAGLSRRLGLLERLYAPYDGNVSISASFSALSVKQEIHQSAAVIKLLSDHHPFGLVDGATIKQGNFRVHVTLIDFSGSEQSKIRPCKKKGLLQGKSLK